MKSNTIVLFLLLTFFVSGKIAAGPAYPYFIQMTQPNGEILTVKMKGDERMKWMESEDGYSLVYDKNKAIVFAQKNERGDMVPSEIMAGNVEVRSAETAQRLKNIPKNLQYSPKQTAALQQLWNIKQEASLRSGKETKATAGTIHVLCALIGFPDMPFVHTKEEFEQLMNQTGYVNGIQKGSVRDYYMENSYGKLDMVFTVVGPYTAQYNHDYYGENEGDAKDIRAEDLAKEVADFAFKDPAINPADFDNDGDGYIDAFHFLYAGYGEESGASANSIWAHKYGFWPELRYGNKRLDVYSCSPELRSNTGNHMTYIGAICHEACHVFGAPDYYDTDGKENGDFLGTGKWDLMAGGSWNNQGATPAHINMFQKIAFGWVTPVELSSPETITGMPNSVENPVAYIIRSADPDEYYLLENRQKIGFDASVPGNGLLIYHVNYNRTDFLYNTVNNRHPQGIYPVCAGSSSAIPTEAPSSYGSINNSRCTYPIIGFMGNDNFTDQSTPSAFLWTGRELGKPVTDIVQKDKLISFNFMPQEFSLNLKAQMDGSRVTLTWEKPASEKEIKGYKIYRNNQLILQTTNTTYRETLNAEGTYMYGVSVVFEGGEESAVQTVDVVYKGTGIDAIHPSTVDPSADFSLYTISGQLVRRGKINTYGQQTMNLPVGVYIVKIERNQQISTLKIAI
ncbi:MAG: M6 family metalloprotease domain-containing protein [Dysgonamonadaceae bacterium]|nr:M6 family metalloprotease domain-containing protein [Dysgonamonadaceae bacterium]